MNVIIESPFTVTEAQEQDITSQIKALANFNQRITSADVFFKLDDGNAVDSVLAEVQFHIPGSVIFASDTSTQFMNAFTGALGKAKKQLIKAKDQRRSH